MLIVSQWIHLDNTAFERYFYALSGCRTRVTIAPILSVDPSTNRIGLLPTFNAWTFQTCHGGGVPSGILNGECQNEGL